VELQGARASDMGAGPTRPARPGPIIPIALTRLAPLGPARWPPARPDPDGLTGLARLGPVRFITRLGGLLSPLNREIGFVSFVRACVRASARAERGHLFP
jgi:hypothetical protein